ncbi:MAG: CatA-like O-acetyltransferase [Bacteroidota bacterium]
MNYREIEVESWARRATYEWFKDFDDPFFEMTASLDVDRLFRLCKTEGRSFYLGSTFWSIHAANQLDEMKTRIRDGKVIVYDKIEAGNTVLHADQSFSFCYFPYEGDWDMFEQKGQAAIEAEMAQKSFDPRLSQQHVIHYSTIPWIPFTSFKHARKSVAPGQDTIPKLVFGQAQEINGSWRMPLSVSLHHALADGYHMGEYFRLFQQMLHDLNG